MGQASALIARGKTIGEAWTDKHGDRWWPAPSRAAEGHYCWGRIRDGVILEVTPGHVELNWSPDRYVRIDTYDEFGWIADEFLNVGQSGE